MATYVRIVCPGCDGWGCDRCGGWGVLENDLDSDSVEFIATTNSHEKGGR